MAREIRHGAKDLVDILASRAQEYLTNATSAFKASADITNIKTVHAHRQVSQMDNA
jgi:hypothetical protein